MSDMVERVANVLYSHDDGTESLIAWDEAVELARYAIAAMRESTPARMVTAGWAALYEQRSALPSEAGVEAVWRAMIDAALQD